VFERETFSQWHMTEVGIGIGFQGSFRGVENRSAYMHIPWEACASLQVGSLRSYAVMINDSLPTKNTPTEPSHV
jgi:hypothetical protein